MQGLPLNQGLVGRFKRLGHGVLQDLYTVNADLRGRSRQNKRQDCYVYAVALLDDHVIPYDGILTYFSDESMVLWSHEDRPRDAFVIHIKDVAVLEVPALLNTRPRTRNGASTAISVSTPLFFPAVPLSANCLCAVWSLATTLDMSG